jgi:hypothetical protein
MVINNQALVGRFVSLTFCTAAIHFILESLYTIKFGQLFLSLLFVLIVDALAVIGGVLVLKNPKTAGVLCGA